MLYLLDENALIDAKRDYYPMNRIPQFWDWLIYQGWHGNIKIPQEVHDALTDEKNDDLACWLRDNKGPLILNESVELALLNAVMEHGYGNELTENEIQKLNRDPFLIAYALVDIENRCVVTTENSSPKRQRANRKIPDICADFGVCFRHTFELIDEMDFHTDWNTRNI